GRRRTTHRRARSRRARAAGPATTPRRIRRDFPPAENKLTDCLAALDDVALEVSARLAHFLREHALQRRGLKPKLAVRQRGEPLAQPGKPVRAYARRRAL